MKIYLIGMPGSGKSTLGQLLAERFSLPFVDLDTVIEDQQQKAVSDIFREQGEDHFRLIESQLLLEWAGSEKSFVMATGGGAPCFHQGIDIINQSGMSIFLDVSIDVLLNRLHSKTDRPLLNSINAEEKDKKLKAIRTSRLICYRKAHLTVTDPTLAKLMEAIQLKK
ncbi:MAG TPA: shikimate kinase [Chryseolinea sp.]|nr:shikimate kinase [Chryseolinea sp.]